ncbi:MAG: succinate--CoA ligase subunit alpha [Bacteroidetes bacterium HGW-Bacteroidetes-4]|jgi:succinyl-CoA synthetase alpha subunit|nr:MAG: succinate--CoA ligase subunit alpha [Bacteroidetes bacterium HGW-Bacteroidetes-4]
MSILINKDTKLVIQGITGRDGGFHAEKMKAYGTKVVAGVTPGKEGQNINGVPVFNTVANAVKATGANTSVVFVPPGYAADAIAEASEAGIKLVIAITEGIPTIDVIRITPILERNGTKMIGPNCPGLISPGKSMVGILPTMIFKEGNVGLISRSGTLTYEMVNQLTTNGIGQSTCIGIGGDPVIGLHYIELLTLFQNDKDTEAIVLCGEIGGDAEEQAAAFIKEHVTKPVVAFIAGQSAPPGKRMGHAGALITSGSGTASEKIKAFEAAGVRVAKEPADIPLFIKEALKL